MTFFGSIVTIALAIFLAYILIQIYFDITERLGIPNAFSVALEILGGYILGIMLCMERGTDYGE